jgi:diguanylate cyclase (GGDEF)-like protein/PAS domain S-box-containing protein
MKLDYEMLLANIRDGVYFTDREMKITYWNKAAERITGYKAREVIGKRCRENILIHLDKEGHSLCRSHCPLSDTIAEKKACEAHVYLHHKLGHRIPVHIRTNPLIDEDGKVVGAVEFFTDTTAYPSMQQRIVELEKLALLDALTQLPNRNHLKPAIDTRFHELRRMGLKFGLLFMDIDHFKHVNDTYGHETGDRVLLTVARTLSSATRPFDLVGRWGGEEFLGIVRNIDQKKLAAIGDRLRLLVSKSSVYYKDNRRLTVTISVGATLANENDTREYLIHRADQLMYASKKQGRNRVTVG